MVRIPHQKEKYKDSIWYQGKLHDTQSKDAWSEDERKKAEHFELCSAFVYYGPHEYTRIWVATFDSPEECSEEIIIHNQRVRRI